MSKLKDRWREELQILYKDMTDLLSTDSTVKKKNKGHSKTAAKEIAKLLKIVESLQKRSRIDDDDVMDLLNSIVSLSQITSSQVLINIIQRRADYFWELHAEFLKRRNNK